MPIKLTPFTCSTLCHGYFWNIVDDDTLARHIARIALGQSRHVEQILSAVANKVPATSSGAKASAIRMLTVSSGSEPWHRDGWMFQAMSWIAARKVDPKVRVRAPQMILAHKGFDGLSITLDSSKQKVLAAVIFEDKATDNPRTTINEKVWPDFKALELGERENELTAELVSLLEGIENCDIDAVIEQILWSQIRQYRVSVTAGKSHCSEKGSERLFKGFEEAVLGRIEKRRGEALYIPDLRPWMESLAQKAITIISSL